MKKQEVEVKVDDLSFPHDANESFKDRLLSLMGERSVRQAAKDWKLPYSTLNNYIVRGTVPTLNVVIDICSIEKVSLDWLASGKGISKMDDAIASANQPQSCSQSNLMNAWMMLLNSLKDYESLNLLHVIQRKGIEGVINWGSTPALCGDIEKVINELPIRDTAKQIFHVVLSGDETTDREILHRLVLAENSKTPSDKFNSEQVSKHAG